MNTAKMTLDSTVLVAAFGLALGLMGAPATAHDCTRHNDPSHKHCDTGGGGGGAGGGGGGGTTPIVADIVSGSALDPDLVGSMYSDSERDIKANAGPGIFINLRGTGNDPRTVLVGDEFVEFGIACTNPDLGEGVIIGGENGCNFLDGLDRQTFGVQRADVFLAARPYAVNCPEGGECLDVFSLSDGDSAEMGFAVVFSEGVRLDIASAVGGFTAKNPGRCLSVMTEAERRAFLATSCDPATNCNVTVTAHASVPGGPNDSWNIVAANDTGLICNLFPDVFVIGVATGVTFEIQADVE